MSGKEREYKKCDRKLLSGSFGFLRLLEAMKAWGA
jgi:hypothetical protein